MRALASLIIGLVAGLALMPNLPHAQPQDAGHAEAAAVAPVDTAALERTAFEAVADRAVPTSRQVQLSYAAIVGKAAPAVVNVYTKRVVRSPMMEDPFFRFFFGERGGAGRERVERSLGSGVIVRANGTIVTNNHVIDGADQILVVLADRREFPAKLVLADARMDLAVLRIDAGPRPLPFLPMGNSDRAAVGDVVFAIGDPFGVGQTVTHGIISALARTGTGINDFDFFIQTDAAINRGNSGGALVDSTGALIGINTAIFSPSGGSNGIGFAIPVNLVRTFVDASGTGKLVRPWLGVDMQPIDADLARTLGLGRPVGVLVNRVRRGSPAETAGLRSGDILFAVDGKEVADPQSVRFRLATRPIGAAAVLTIIRAGKASNLKVGLMAPPEVPPRRITVLRAPGLFSGTRVANLSPALAEELGGTLPEAGLVVLDFAPNAPAQRFLQPGDVLEQVNGRPTPNVDSLLAVLSAARDSISVRARRGGQAFECGVSGNRMYCRQ